MRADGSGRVAPADIAGFEAHAPRGARHGWRLALAAGAALGIGAVAGYGLRAPDRNANEQLVLGAQLAERQCYRLIHHDTFEYRDCLRGLLFADNRPGPKRLGVEYFGWAGAVNSARVGMKGAEATADEFLHRFRATQEALGIDDRRLCAAIPGDCVTRMAVMRHMEAAPPRPADVSAEDETTGHGQGH